MGALGGSQGEPVSFYVQVIPIGEKLAATAVAVGANLVREADGSVTTPGNFLVCMKSQRFHWLRKESL
jgi:hypothetical protein